MRKRKLLFHTTRIISVIIILFLLTSCGETGSAEDILFQITKDIDSLPEGTVYLGSAVEGEAFYLSPMMISALYGEGAYEYEFTFIEDFAVYLSSFAKPCEVAVYKCYSRSDTDLVASMCLRRIESLSTTLGGTSLSEIPKNAKIEIKGNFVIVVMV